MTEMSWKCSNCGYVLVAMVPPEECPSCKTKCQFVDVTCYIPECEGQMTDNRLGNPIDKLKKD